MSSESNGRKSDTPDSGSPPTATAAPSKTSARVASAWGPSRGALAAFHNLEALLRSASVSQKTILDLVPELRSSAEILRAVAQGEASPASAAEDSAGPADEISGRADDDAEARRRVSAFGLQRAVELDRLLDDLEAGGVDRQELATRAHDLTDRLEAVIDLLALLDLAAAPVATEVSLDFVAREVGRMSGTARGREIVVRFDEAKPDRAVVVDPYVLGALLALVVACVEASAESALVLRARSKDAAMFVVERATDADASLPVLGIRVLACIEPSALAARRVAAQLGGHLDMAGDRASIIIGAAAPSERDD